MEVLFKNDYLKVISAKNEDGGEYYFTMQNDKVVVLPYTIRNKKVNIFTLMEPIKLWGRKKEITAVTGSLEEGEDPHKCAVRELKEEIGIYAPWGSAWEYLGEFYPQKSTVDCRHLYLVDVTNQTIVGKPTDGSWFEQVTNRVLSDLDIQNMSRDVVLHYMIERLKNKFQGSSLI